MLYSAAFSALVLVTASIRAAPYAYAPAELNSADLAWPSANVIQSDFDLPLNATDDEWLVARAAIPDLVPDSVIIPPELEARDLARAPELDERAFSIATARFVNPKFRTGKTRTIPAATPVAQNTAKSSAKVSSATSKASSTKASSAATASATPVKATVTDQATLAQYADWSKRYVRTASQGKYVFYNTDGASARSRMLVLTF